MVSTNDNEDIPLDITLNASDAENDLLSYEMDTLPNHGKLSGEAPNLNYTPNENFNGEDSFTFQADDGKKKSGLATVKITVEPVNDIPVAQNQSLKTTEDTDLEVNLIATDIEGDNLNYSLVKQPAHGNLSGEAPSLVYTPNENFVGVDNLTFKVNDNKADSEIATINIKVGGSNDAPVAEGQTLNADEDVAINVTLSANDVDGDALAYIITQPTIQGTLSGVVPDLIYTPKKDFHGSDSFSFKASDGTEDSNEATVKITVNPINDVPVADFTMIPFKGTAPIKITFDASNSYDIDGDNLHYNWNFGDGEATEGKIVEHRFAAAGFYTVKLTVNDNDGGEHSISKSIEIDANIAPIANDQKLSTKQYKAIDIVLTASDTEGDNLTYTITNQPEHGELTGTAPNLKYEPNEDYTVFRHPII